MTLPAAGGKATRVLHVGKDLRDVIVSGDRLVVSHFRSAELIVLDSDGKPTNVQKPPGIGTESPATSPRTTSVRPGSYRPSRTASSR